MTGSFLYMLDIDNYSYDVSVLVKAALRSLDRLGYISLNRTAKSVQQFCVKNEIDLKSISIIDLVSNRIVTPKSENGVFYLDLSDNVSVLLKSIINVIEKTGCTSVLFDSLSSLELYYPDKELIRFVHDLLVYLNSENIISVLILQKKDSEKDWAKSIIPLVDEVKEVGFKIDKI